MHGNRAVVLAALALVVAAGPWAVAPAGAQSAAPAPAKKAPAPAKKASPYVVLRADEATFDENTGIVTATGKVEIAHGMRVLRADKVIYDERRDTVTAIGNVALLEPSGDVMFSDRAEFTDGMKEGIVEGFRMLFKDNSRLAAAGGKRAGGIITTLNKAVFSPCNLCKEDPKRAPLWRVRAVRVTHDAENKEIEYHDAFLEMFGIPIAYTPYLSHPDPTVTRRTGLLAPSYSSDSEFGLILRTPYFWAIEPNEDLTITPHFMTQEASVLEAEYRNRFTNGELTLRGSITRPDRQSDGAPVAGRETRGHIDARGRFDHNDIWRTKFQVQHATDDTYLRRYGFPIPSNETLTTSFNTEGFKGRNYAQVSGYSFQGLRLNDDPGKSPLVLPFGEYNFVSRPYANGSYLTADTSLRAVTRDEGADSQRLSFKGGWHLPYTAPSGEIYSLSASLQADAYSVNDVVTSPGTVERGMTGRVFPQIMAQWRYPFVQSTARARQLIEPIAAVVLATNGGNPDKIPNEDSLDVEFDDTNLFSQSRFTGVDRVDSGHRFVYGVNWGLYGNNGGAIEAFLGQSYRLRSENIFAQGSGLDDKASDIVGRLRISPASYLDLLYRFRVDPDSTTAQRNEVSVSAGPSWFRVAANYLFISEEAGAGQFGDREELALNLNYKFSDYWQAYAHIREDLADDGGTRSEGIGVTYQDECFIFKASFTRKFTEDRDLKPTDTLFFQLIFKHLGEFGSSG